MNPLYTSSKRRLPKMTNKKENKLREESPRSKPKPKRKLLPFERFKQVDWKIFMPVEEKVQVGEK